MTARATYLQDILNNKLRKLVGRANKKPFVLMNEMKAFTKRIMWVARVSLAEHNKTHQHSSASLLCCHTDSLCVIYY